MKSEQSRTLYVEGSQSHQDITCHLSLLWKRLEDVLQQGEDINQVRQKRRIHVNRKSSHRKTVRGSSKIMEKARVMERMAPDQSKNRDLQEKVGTDILAKAYKHLEIIIDRRPKPFQSIWENNITG